MKNGNDAHYKSTLKKCVALTSFYGFQVIQVGNLCGGKRLDYMLQEKEIENANEYLSALAAHSSYWGEKDLSLFMARQIFHSEQPILLL